jgi:uncharacterized protein YukJ
LEQWQGVHISPEHVRLLAGVDAQRFKSAITDLSYTHNIAEDDNGNLLYLGESGDEADPLRHIIPGTVYGFSGVRRADQARAE